MSFPMLGTGDIQLNLVQLNHKVGRWLELCSPVGLTSVDKTQGVLPR